MCKHFGHKINVEFTPESGVICFPFGRCELTAEAGTLSMTAIAENVDSHARVETIIGSHLERFAFREKPEINWTKA